MSTPKLIVEREQRHVEFTAERYSCINAKCWAVVELNDDGTLHDVVEWGDEYTSFNECPERIWVAIAEECPGWSHP